jgi:hypothetical protein
VRRVEGAGRRWRTREGNEWDWMSMAKGDGAGVMLTLRAKIVR